MALQFEHVLAGERVRRREIQREAVIDGSPRRRENCASRARRGAGMPPSIARAIRGTSGPDTRTMPTAPRPGGLAIATMVSAEVTAYKCTRPAGSARGAASRPAPQERCLPASACTTWLMRHCCTIDSTVFVNQ